MKSEEQKKKRKEIELMHTEVAVLKRTIDIVSKRYNKLETHIVSCVIVELNVE